MRQQPRFLGAPPVVVDVVAFDLVRGGGRAPQEAAWETHSREISTHFNVLVDDILFSARQTWHKAPPHMAIALNRLTIPARGSTKSGSLPILAAIFAFNLGSGAWSAVVAGRLTRTARAPRSSGVLYAVCEISRLPAALLLPRSTLQHGARRVTQAGLLVLLALPLIGLTGLGNGQVMLIFVLTALPAMAVYVGMPALVIGASRAGRDGWALAWLGMAGGAGGALGRGPADCWRIRSGWCRCCCCSPRAVR